MQRSVAVAGLGIYVGILGNQQFGDLSVTIRRRVMEGRKTFPVSTRHQVGVAAEQHPRLRQVAISGGMKKLGRCPVRPVA